MCSDKKRQAAAEVKVGKGKRIDYSLKKYHICKNEAAQRVGLDGGGGRQVTSAAFCKHLHLLVTGCADGAFFLHEMPDFNLIHSLR